MSGASEVVALARRAAQLVVDRAHRCSHGRCRERVQGYTGGVANTAATMEPRAAGGICTVKTCLDCGSLQKTNTNGRWEEVGPWWEPTVERLLVLDVPAVALDLYRAQLSTVGLELAE